MSTFLVFISRVDHLVIIHTKVWLKIAFKKLYLQINDFLKFFCPKLCDTRKVFQNTANLKSMSMQMISDKMHFDAVALRPKYAI